MKIFNQTFNINSNAYKIDANFNLLLIIALCVSIYLTFKFTIFILDFNDVVKALSILIIPYLFYLEFEFIFLNIKHYIIKKKTYKTHPIYHFMQPVSRKVANNLYSDLNCIWDEYINKKRKKELNKIKLKTDNDKFNILFEELDAEVFKTLQNYYLNNNLKQLEEIKSSQFDLYKKLFMHFVAPVEIAHLRNKLNKIKNDFAYKENKMRPEDFLTMLYDLEFRINKRFTENDYIQYKNWHSAILNILNSIINIQS